jgi:hypothetical protein
VALSVAGLMPFLAQEMVAQVPAVVTENLIKIGVAGIGKSAAAAAAGGKVWLTGGLAKVTLITIGVALTGVAVWQVVPQHRPVTRDKEEVIFFDDLEQGTQKWQAKDAVPDSSIYWNIRLVDSTNSLVTENGARNGSPNKCLVLDATGSSLRGVQITCPGLSKLPAYAIEFDVCVNKHSKESKVQLGVPVPAPGDTYVRGEEPKSAMSEGVWLHVRRDVTPCKTPEGADAQILTTTVDGKLHVRQMMQVRSDSIAFVAQDTKVEIDNLKLLKVSDTETIKRGSGAN